jgi:hypothetical protein
MRVVAHNDDEPWCIEPLPPKPESGLFADFYMQNLERSHPNERGGEGAINDDVGGLPASMSSNLREGSLREVKGPHHEHGPWVEETSGKIHRAEWSTELGKVLDEMFAVHMDAVLGFNVVPPGRFVAFEPWDVFRLFTTASRKNEVEFADKLLLEVEDPNTWARYLGEKALTNRSTYLFGFLQIAVPNLRVVGKNAGGGGNDASGTDRDQRHREEVMGMKEWECHSFCAYNDTLTMERDTNNCKSANSAQNNSCCHAKMVPANPQVFLLSQLMLKGDAEENCFAANFGTGFQSVALDFDNLYFSTESRYFQGYQYNKPEKWLNCAFYPKPLRDHVLKQAAHIKNENPTTQSPLFAAVLNSMYAELEQHYKGTSVPIIVHRWLENEANVSQTKMSRLSPAQRRLEGANQGIYFWGFPVEAMQNVTSPIDQQLNSVVDLFEGCSKD